MTYHWACTSTSTREFPISGVTFIRKMRYLPYPILGPFPHLSIFFKASLKFLKIIDILEMLKLCIREIAVIRGIAKVTEIK